MTLTAAEVVSNYLANKRTGRGDFAAVDAIIQDSARAIVQELPDGFKRRDVINCVKAMTADTPELAEIKPYRRTMVAGKTLKAMCEANEIKENDGAYYHVAF